MFFMADERTSVILPVLRLTLTLTHVYQTGVVDLDHTGNNRNVTPSRISHQKWVILADSWWWASWFAAFPSMTW